MVVIVIATPASPRRSCAGGRWRRARLRRGPRRGAALADPHGEGGVGDGDALPGPAKALEEERDFLLKSLADLDAELAAGDIDEADHRALTDDQHGLTAEVLRAIEEHREKASRPLAHHGRAGASSWPSPGWRFDGCCGVLYRPRPRVGRTG